MLLIRIQWYSQFLKEFNSLINLSIHLPCDPANPLQVFYSIEMETCPHKDLHGNFYSNFIHDSQKWKQTKFLSTGEWVSCDISV